MANSNVCLEMALRKSYRDLTGQEIEFGSTRSVNSDQVEIITLIVIINNGEPSSPDFAYPQESGNDADSLARALNRLDKTATYILRAGVINGSGHFSNVYFEPGRGWILQSGPTFIYQLTDHTGSVCEMLHNIVHDRATVSSDLAIY